MRRQNIINRPLPSIPARWSWGSREHSACDAQLGAALVHEQAAYAYGIGRLDDARRYQLEAAERYAKARALMGVEG